MMMQKRTNPLELKVDNSARREAAPEPKTIDPVAAIVEPVKAEAPAPKVAPAAPAAKPIEPPVEKKPLVKRPTVKPIAPVAEPESVVEQTPEIKAAPVMGGAVRWERVSAYKPAPAVEPVTVVPTVEPEPVVIEQEPVAELEEEIVETVEQDELIGDEMVESESADDDADEFDAEDGISDEQEPLTIDDYMMSARFSLCGRISRGVKVANISRDVCRLAQLMHPEKSLSAILEDALLTRIYLENPDAFDALAEMLEKKGGHIKC